MRVARRNGRMRLLVTGDSMIQPLDDYLRLRLRPAAAQAPAAARLIRLDRYFTPGGRFRASMRIGGRTVQVRQRDGVHLSKNGAAAAARLVVRALRREQIVG